MWILRNKLYFFIIGALLVAVSLVFMIGRGFVPSIDFVGGSLLEISYTATPDIELVRSLVVPIVPSARVQSIGETSLVIRTEPMSFTEKEVIIKSLSNTGTFSEERFTTIGPSIGSELRRKAIIALILVSIGIILFVAYVFRGVSAGTNEKNARTGVSSWVYGIIAVLVLVHDVMIPAGVFAFFRIPVDTLFIVGLLTILGVSVNDTIVVFDRIRERLHINTEKKIAEPFSDVVGKSIGDTMTRSLMTSGTVLLALLALLIWGPESTRNLSLVMFLGMFFGTYSSIFLAAPLLVVWNNRKEKKL